MSDQKLTHRRVTRESSQAHNTGNSRTRFRFRVPSSRKVDVGVLIRSSVFCCRGSRDVNSRRIGLRYIAVGTSPSDSLQLQSSLVFWGHASD